MKRLMVCVALLALACGCGNVQLRGEALTAAETSAMDAFQAARRAETEPAWQKAYLEENFKQWRSFVRSARKDETWGPALPAESAVEREGE